MNFTGWTPSSIGDSFTFKVIAQNRIDRGSLFWSNLVGMNTMKTKDFILFYIFFFFAILKTNAGPSPASYQQALELCRIADPNNDKDGDGFSYCDSFDLNYFDCNDFNFNVNPEVAEICNLIDDK